MNYIFTEIVILQRKGFSEQVFTGFGMEYENYLKHFISGKNRIIGYQVKEHITKSLYLYEILGIFRKKQDEQK